MATSPTEGAQPAQLYCAPPAPTSALSQLRSSALLCISAQYVLEEVTAPASMEQAQDKTV